MAKMWYYSTSVESLIYLMEFKFFGEKFLILVHVLYMIHYEMTGLHKNKHHFYQ